MYPDTALEIEIWETGARFIAGIDEVGRGPLAGPILAASVVFPAYTSSEKIPGLRDSKMMSPNLRCRVAPLIQEVALGIGIGRVNPADIDRIGIAAAGRLAMERALDNLPVAVDYLLIDAFPLSYNQLPCTAVTHGDSVSISIAAASVIAKVARDIIMQGFASKYPGYGFERHKGYPTREHLQLLSKLGPSNIHRKSFAPVRTSLEGTNTTGF